MSSAQGGPVILKYRPAFALPVLVEYIALSQVDRFQSFPFLPGYQNVSFEEQRLEDTTPLPTMADNKFGILSASSLKSLKAAVEPLRGLPEKPEDMLGPKLPIVAICVGRGEDTTLFGIHQNILEHCSPFFQALLNEDIPIGIKTEMETRPVSEIRFEGDIEAFEVYTEWVYSGRVFKKKLRDDEGSAKFLSYGQAYILGEKLLNHDFKNEVLDTLLTEILSGGKIDLTLATLVYEGTAKTSPLRRLLVDIYTWYGHKDWLRYGNNKSHPPPSFCQTSLPLFSSVTITTQPSKTDILSGTHAGTTNIPLDKIAQHLITEAILES
ncbi:hypothetical protein D6C87_10149 [Aureobasidium pullulans]|uniref:BTB domain-containing protein n=1 Tax=Aureobasidium pullulans TaxID=5580 RepID=A0AB38M7X0_AURPU|nr:hypothetical protein D6C94_01013 [Aureobasidium pullulans]THZ34912.1 hypothetical protein D6C87_10149 [Aureobasidium pullulans]